MQITDFFKKNQRIIFIFLGIILFISFWDIIALATSNKYIEEFFYSLYMSFNYLFKKDTLLAFSYTFFRLFFSLTVSIISGIILGLLAGYFFQIDYLLKPTLSVIKAFPLIALLLMFISRFKYYEIIVNFFVIFPLIFYQMSSSTSKIKNKYNDVLRVDGKNKFIENSVKVILPLSLNSILVSILQSIAIAFKAEITIESFGYSSKSFGLGKLIYQSYSLVEYHQMMYYIIISLCISVVLDVIVTLLIKKIKIIDCK